MITIILLHLELLKTVPMLLLKKSMVQRKLAILLSLVFFSIMFYWRKDDVSII